MARSGEIAAAFQDFPEGWDVKSQGVPPGWRIVDRTSRLAGALLIGEIGTGSPFTYILEPTEPPSEDKNGF